ncbi:hypothetical protein QWJ26_40475 [Streptomyces sp. CSDS2]|uniref:hypothetical protein n=1 Tax=Streptomyces sp. CSDS2 TaxID=3055051 RepID=UPI0025B1E791|nr:hypothetical protein [Streptomyces sp. CSDS2]MDN3265946.1 hypothetical protein [Streptomyces sp. CSDS2]
MTATEQGRQCHRAVGPPNANCNGTSRTARSTFASQVTGEVGVSAIGKLETSVGTLIAKVKAKYEVNVSAKLTAKTGDSVSVDTPSHTTTHTTYGV